MIQRRGLLISTTLWIGRTVAGRGQTNSTSNKSDNRTIPQKIDDFLTLRLTREVIQVYIFDPLLFAFKGFTGSAERVMPLYRAVSTSKFSYDALWQRLDDFKQNQDSPSRKVWAQQAAKQAAAVNQALTDFRAAVVALDAGSHKILDPELDHLLESYAGVPATVDEFDRFLQSASDSDVNRIVSESKGAREIVTQAHNCFLCFLSKRFGHPSPKGFDCAKCGNA